MSLPNGIEQTLLDRLHAMTNATAAEPAQVAVKPAPVMKADPSRMMMMAASRDSGYISWCCSRAMSRTTRSRFVSSVPVRPAIHLHSAKPNPALATSFAGCRWPPAVRLPRWSSQRHIAAPTIDGGSFVIPIRSKPRKDNCIDGWHCSAWFSKKSWLLGIIIPARCLPIESFFAGDSGGDEVALPD